jgi:hypothetical protein
MEETDVLKKYKTALGVNDLDIKIENGSMFISPSDVGISLFAYINMTENSIADYDKEIENLYEKIETLRTDNSNLRDLLERTSFTLTEAGYPELTAEILEAVYPVVGLTEEEVG